MTNGRKIRVLIVDDSAIVRKVLSEALAAEADLEVVGTAPDPFVARDKILTLKPDVLTLDIDMPRMDGITFLKRLMHHLPMPVIVISSFGESSSRIALDALAAGAVEVVAKPDGPYSVGELCQSLASKIRAASGAQVRNYGQQREPQRNLPDSSTEACPFDPSMIIAIGASTGGTEALQIVLTQLPADCPGILIVQHIPPVFSRALANRLNEICRIRVREAEDGDTPEPGLALIAPGNFHMVLKGFPGGYRVEVKGGPPVCYQRPSVDVLFHSVALAAGGHAIGAILTGMGADGARGLLAMKESGARTIAQGEASCVVFGMPREAIQLGAADRVVSLDQIPFEIIAQARR